MESIKTIILSTNDVKIALADYVNKHLDKELYPNTIVEPKDIKFGYNAEEEEKYEFVEARYEFMPIDRINIIKSEKPS